MSQEEPIAYEVIQHGVTVDMRVMTHEQMLLRRQQHPGTTYLPLCGVVISAPPK